MKVRITLGKLPWAWSQENHLSSLKAVHQRLNDLFLPYAPKLLSGVVRGAFGYPTHELSVPVDDPEFKNRIQQFDQELKKTKPRIGGFFEAFTETEETKRARLIEPYVLGDSVDEDSNYKPLNRPARILCDACQFPDITQVPTPYLVSNKTLKKQDIFGASTGMLVVRAPVMKLLQDVIGEQIETGEATIAKAKQKLVGDDRLFWVRPKAVLKNESPLRIDKPCPKCKRPSGCGRTWGDTWVNSAGTGLHDGRHWVESFAPVDIAVLDPFYGRIENGVLRGHWCVLMSGALVAHLQANGFKGIFALSPQAPARIFFSKRDEPTLEVQPRAFGGTAANQPKTSSLKKQIEKGCAEVAALKGVPWDCDKEGWVYFHLTTPELMVLDPMTWEEDSDGPYRVTKFKKPGLYRMSVKAIKDAEGKKRGVAVDSGTLLFIDNAFFSELQDRYEWDKAIKSNGTVDLKYHDKVAAEIGTRFAVCSAPPKKFKSQFVGDGFYTIDPKGITVV